MRWTGSICGVWVLLLTAGCGAASTEVDPVPPSFTANIDVAVIAEEVEGDGRQYVRIEEGDLDFWVSAPAEPALAVGDKVWLGQGPEIKPFKSAELARTFDAMVKIDQVAVANEIQVAGFSKLDPPEGGTSIEAVYAKRVALAGKPVKVRGRVVKASMDVFDTNWYHLRDGSGAEGTNDLTFTTDETFKVGDVVVASGELTIDKDLGFGYFYEAIVEEGTLSKE